jgi:hypothetical protein
VLGVEAAGSDPLQLPGGSLAAVFAVDLEQRRDCRIHEWEDYALTSACVLTPINPWLRLTA